MDAHGTLPAEWTAQWEHYVERKVDPRSTTETLKAKERDLETELQQVFGLR